MTKASNQQTATETCPACPAEVRSLYAAAHNACLALKAAMSGAGEWTRAVRKLDELQDAVARMEPIVEAHFADAEHSGVRKSSPLVPAPIKGWEHGNGR